LSFAVFIHRDGHKTRSAQPFLIHVAVKYPMFPEYQYTHSFTLYGETNSLQV